MSGPLFALPPAARNVRGIVLGIVVFGMLSFAIYEHFAYGPTAKAKVQAFEAEARLIHPPPDDRLYRQHSGNKSRQALVDYEFVSHHSFAELRAHYESQLIARGWSFSREKSLTDWGRDQGGKQVCYRRGEDTACIEYTGEKADTDWTYSVSFSWGLGICN